MGLFFFEEKFRLKLSEILLNFFEILEDKVRRDDSKLIHGEIALLLISWERIVLYLSERIVLLKYFEVFLGVENIARSV